MAKKSSTPQRFESEHFDIDAKPAKAFFVWMITRDIDLADALLDLIDNCVDGARRAGLKNGDQPFKGYWAEITFDEGHFCIRDNCGGIPRNVAEEYAFKMGRPDGKGGKTAGTVGVYGIGMKRAIFKMGKSCTVRSQTGNEAFEVSIKPNWLLDDQNWKLPADTVLPLDSELGTSLKVDVLHSPIAKHFKLGSPFSKEFPKLVEAAMSLIIQRGFQIRINAVPVKASVPSLLWTENIKGGKGIRPHFYRGTVEGMDVFLVVGFRGKTTTSAEDPEQPTASWDIDDAGWTVACNDRIVLSCDRSRATGWESKGIPRYHAQFRAISGFVEFHSKEAKNLPMTTTKRGVDLSSSAYQHVLERMAEGLKKFTSATHDWKGAEDELNTILGSAEAVPLPTLVERAKALSFSKLRGQSAEAVCDPIVPERKRVETTKRISFVRPINDIEKVAEFLFEDAGVSSHEVGSACFDKVFKQATQ